MLKHACYSRNRQNERSIACGEPIYCDEEYKTFIEASADIHADFCLTAKGDSMINARIYDYDGYYC